MPSTNKKPNLTNTQRNSIATFLLRSANPKGTPGRGKFNEAAQKWEVSRRTISAIWKKAKAQLDEGLPIHVRNAKQDRQRRTHNVNMEMVLSIPAGGRKTIRGLAKSLILLNIKISKSSVGRLVLEGLFKAHTNSIKPHLSADNKLLRLKWSLKAVQVDHILKTIKFKSMKNIIHIDEKWFFFTQATSRYYLVAGEEPTYRSCQSKSHITKFMFVCAVGRPWYSNNGEMIFDGKIGLFPLTKQVPARRSSRNRLAGVVETKSITKVTKDVYRACLINEIIPAIKAKWPANAPKDIIPQQDNATPHINNEDPEFRMAADRDGFTFTLVYQPPQSPDTNVNDLGWFRAIQSLQQESASFNIEQLINAVQVSFRDLDPSKLNKVFLSLQSCMVEIMKQKGHNNYKTPHMKKDRLARLGELPEDLLVDELLIRECLDYLLQIDQCVELNELTTSLGY